MAVRTTKAVRCWQCTLTREFEVEGTGAASWIPEENRDGWTLENTGASQHRFEPRFGCPDHPVPMPAGPR